MKEEVFLKKLGLSIQKFRKERGLTQTELAYRCDFERPSINRIEKGGTNPTAATLKKLAEALDVTVQDFFSFEKAKK